MTLVSQFRFDLFTPSAVTLSCLGEIGVDVVIGMSLWTNALLALIAPTANNIRLMCDWLQMFWVNATSDTANVIEFKARWDGTNHELVNEFVGSEGFIVGVGNSVTFSCESASPKPAAAVRLGQYVGKQFIEYAEGSHVIPPRIASVWPAQLWKAVAGLFYCSAEVAS